MCEKCRSRTYSEDQICRRDDYVECDTCIKGKEHFKVIIEDPCNPCCREKYYYSKYNFKKTSYCR